MSNTDKIQAYWVKKTTLPKVTVPLEVTRPVMPATTKPVMPATTKPVMPATTKPAMLATTRPVMPATTKPVIQKITRGVMPTDKIMVKVSRVSTTHISGHTFVDFESRKMKNSYKALNKKLGEG